MDFLLVMMFVLTCLVIGFGTKLLDRADTDVGEVNESWRHIHAAVRDAASNST
jgi:hypothetical protein